MISSEMDCNTLHLSYTYDAVRRIYLVCAGQGASHEVVCSCLDYLSPFLQEDHTPRSVTSVICTLEHNVCEDLVKQTRNQTPENNNKFFTNP
jgi:hypothetical protein